MKAMYPLALIALVTVIQPNYIDSFVNVSNKIVTKSLSSQGSINKIAATITTKRMMAMNNNDDNKENEDQNSNLVDETTVDVKRRNLALNALGLGMIGIATVGTAGELMAAIPPSGYKKIYPTQFIAALGDPNSSFGKGANNWGIWTVDPGPRGVWLRDYENQLVKTNGNAPSGWKFDKNDWWLEEHGLIMESPNFPLEPGKYLVTGGRRVTTGLTINADGSWKLDGGGSDKLYDVTHLPCRSARYSPLAQSSNDDGTPLKAKQSDFPVKPGAEMPSVEGSSKQDYAVLFVIGKGIA